LLFYYEMQFPIPSTVFRVVTGDEAKAGRKAFEDAGGSGHHRHPIAHGGAPVPGAEGLAFTGESDILASKLADLDLSFCSQYGKGKQKLKIFQATPNSPFQFGRNPLHTAATVFWNEVARWQREIGIR
jgi:hypothetical protein